MIFRLAGLVVSVGLLGCIWGPSRPTPELINSLRLAKEQRRESFETTYRAAVALLAIGHRTSGEARLLDLVRVPRNEFFVDSVQRITKDLGFPRAGQEMEQLAQHSSDLALEKLDQVSRDRLQEMVGVYLLRSGQLDKAAELLSGLSEQPNAQYLWAVIMLRRGNTQQAQEVFQWALDLAKRKGKKDIAELCTLALARISHRAKLKDETIRHYTAIPLDSPHFFRARQELAWVLLETGDPKGSLLQILTLRASNPSRYFRGDELVLESASLLALCQWSQARKQTVRAIKKLTEHVKELNEFLRIRPEVRLYYVEAMASIAGRGKGLSQEMGRVLLADAGFRRAVRFVRQIQWERKLLVKSNARELKKLLGPELDERLIRAQQGAGRSVKRLLVSTLAELQELRERSREILFELDRPRDQQKVREPWPRNDGRQQTWPFTGEFWSDELGAFRLHLGSACL
ncbi:MAG: hypothetical protein V1754_09200 [Pseudomonadota bacterium]